MIRPLVFLDLETDGLHPGRRAWEIAMIRRDDMDGVPIERERSFFLPLNLENSDPTGLAIGRFWDRHPAGRKISGKPFLPGDILPAHEAAKAVMEWTFGATIVGAVPSFDTEVLSRFLRAHGYLPSWHHRLRCVESMTYGAIDEDVGGLAACAEALGLEVRPDTAHTALGDAKLAKAIFDEILKEDS